MMIFFHKIPVSIECCILSTSWACQSRVQEAQTLIPFLKKIKKMRRGSHGSKKSKKLFSEILIQQEKNLTRKTRKWRHTSFFHNLVLHLEEENRKIRSKGKRSEWEDSQIHLRLHHLLIHRALRVGRGSILQKMKINLNETFHLTLHFMQILSLRNVSQRKAFTTQSVKYILY